MTKEVEIKEIKMPMMAEPLYQWTYKSCTANFGVGEEWATLYDIRSLEEGKGHATHLLSLAKEHYEKQGKTFGGSVALNDRMKSIYKRLNITEYNEENSPDYY